MIWRVIGTPRSDWIKVSSSSSQSISLPLNRWIKFLKNPIAIALNGPIGSSPQRAIEIQLYPIQNSVHKLSRFLSAEFFGDVNCFVDGNDRGDIDCIEHFVNCHPQDIAINSRDSFQFIVRGVLRDFGVDGFLISNDSVKYSCSKCANSCDHVAEFPEEIEIFGLWRFPNV